jgi:hypothetical protein
METQKETFKVLIEELRQEIADKVEDTTKGIAKMCLDALDSADECLDVPQCRSSIQAVIATVRTFLKRNTDE